MDSHYMADLQRVDELLQRLDVLESENKELRRQLVECNRREDRIADPDEESGEYNFYDLFDIGEIQSLQDAFSRALGVASIITMPDGTPITAPSNFCRLCNDIIRKTDQGLVNCMHSDCIIGAYNPNGPMVQPCLSGGLWDAGASINAGDRHVANWLIGQVRNEVLDEQEMIEYARKIGADVPAFREALAEVPVMPLEKFTDIARVLYIFANLLSKTALQNLRQKRSLSKLAGLLPICSSCKKIRDDRGYWNQIEIYLATHSDTMFSHGICPDCAEKLYGKQEWYKK
jgi:ligand-binding sensor protein